MTPAADPATDVAAMLPWFDEAGLGSGPLSEVQALTGGTQNVLIAFTRSEKRYVLRRPPLVKRPGSDEAMRREARVLAALAGSSVPHPTLRADCPDAERFGYACFVMDAVPGFTATEWVPPQIASSPSAHQEMGWSALRALLSLQEVSPDAAGFPARAGWLERQVGRWEALFDSHREHAGWAPQELTGIPEIAAWLRQHQPAEARTGLIHGDFHFGNLLFAEQTGAVTSVIDWELATSGDPLLDFGHFLASYPVSQDPRTTGTEKFLAHLPSREELVAEYCAQTGRSAEEVLWFRVLACFRLAIIIEGTHARALAGHAPLATGERLHLAATFLRDQALALISGESLKGNAA